MIDRRSASPKHVNAKRETTEACVRGLGRCVERDEAIVSDRRPLVEQRGADGWKRNHGSPGVADRDNRLLPR